MLTTLAIITCCGMLYCCLLCAATCLQVNQTYKSDMQRLLDDQLDRNLAKLK